MVEIRSALLENYLSKLSTNIKKQREVMHSLGIMVRKSVRERFETKIDPDGNPWERNQPSTIERKGFDDPLIETGFLKKSIYMQSDKDSFMVYTQTPYAIYHQVGTSHVPERAFMGFNDEDEKKAIDIICKELLD
jgi:phage virion morphogenesis protein